MRWLSLFLFLSTLAFAQADGNLLMASAPNAPSAPAIQPAVVAAPAPAEPRNEFGLWSGYSPTSTVSFGQSTDRSFSKVALRYARRVLDTHHGSLRYTFDLVPLAVLRQPNLLEPARRDTFYAAGLSPLGVQWNWRPKHDVQPIASWSGGFLYFNKRIPTPDASQYNYTFDAGVGVQVRQRHRETMTFMLKYNHISNGFQAKDNPGIDSITGTVGFSFLK